METQPKHSGDSDQQIDSFLLYLATERGLSAAYQLSVRQTCYRGRNPLRPGPKLAK